MSDLPPGDNSQPRARRVCVECGTAWTGVDIPVGSLPENCPKCGGASEDESLRDELTKVLAFGLPRKTAENAADALIASDLMNRVRGRSRAAKPPMVMRSHRYPRKLYEDAMAKAEERDENLSDVLREALERYVRRK